MKTSYTQQINTLISKMTVDEKIAQIGSYWMYELQTKGELDSKKMAERLSNGIGQITRVAGSSTLDPVSAAKAGNRLQKYLVEETRLGIPAIFHEESCSGAMILGGTTYPQMIGLASSFQPELTEKIASAIRKQLLAIGARQALAPVLDVSRDPRWGRTEETFGEDTTLVSHFGMAYVSGMQGKDLKNGVMATGKHFIGHSLSQEGLNCGPVHMGMHDVYDIYLAPFQAAIRDAGLAAIMNAYPELDGEVVATSRKILTNILRDELGFDGVVVSDYDAIQMIHNFHYAAPDMRTAACKAINAGIDVELPSVLGYGEPLKSALEAGDIELETVDTAVRRHLQMKFELGLFENPYVDDGKVLEVFETREQRDLAKHAAQQSIVLLKNDGLLPLQKSIGTLAVIGPNADNGRNQLGDYSYAATFELMNFIGPEGSNFKKIDDDYMQTHSIQVTTVLEGIKKTVSADTNILYARGCDNLNNSKEDFDLAVKTAEQADAVILVLGDKSGLVHSCTTGEFRDTDHLNLPGVQEDLAKAVIATGKPVILVLVNGRPYSISWLNENVNAILEAWLPGEEGGTAIADVLFGDCNPGGKLPLSIPRHAGQLPIFYNYKPSGNISHAFDDSPEKIVTPLYPFGYGLSYTSFEYSNFSISKPQATLGDTVDISLNVTNTGKTAGDEIVQLYIRDEYASMPRPVKELKGYQRLKLQAGETKTVVFHLSVDQLAFYDLDFKLTLEAGRIFVMVGSSSQDIRLNGEFTITGPEKMYIEKRVFICPVEIQ